MWTLNAALGGGAWSLRGVGRTDSCSRPGRGLLTGLRCCCHPAAAAPCGGRPSPAPGSVCPAHCSASGSSASPAPGPVGTVRTSVGQEPSRCGKRDRHRPISGQSNHLLESWPARESRGTSGWFYVDSGPRGCLEGKG